MRDDTIPQTVLFPDLFNKPLVATFDQPHASSDGGAILLKAIAAVAALITVRLSIRQFSSQRWWERKADAYSSIVEALFHQLGQAWRILDAEERGLALGRIRGAEDQTQGLEAQRTIHQTAAAGAFIVSEEAAEHLETLRRKLAAAGDVRGGGLYERRECRAHRLTEVHRRCTTVRPQ